MMKTYYKIVRKGMTSNGGRKAGVSYAFTRPKDQTMAGGDEVWVCLASSLQEAKETDMWRLLAMY